MIAYFIEGALVTMFVAAQVVEIFRHRSRTSSSGPQNRLRSIMDSFRASLSTFFWASVLLCLGIMAASLNSLAASSEANIEDQISKWKQGGTFATYDAYLAVMASACCSFPVFLSGLLLQTRGRRRRLLNGAIMVSIGVLLIAIWALFLQSTNNRAVALRQLLSTRLVPIFDSNELRLGPFSYALLTGIVLFSCLGFAGLMTLIVAICFSDSRYPTKRVLPQGYMIFISLVVQTILLGVMWSTLAQFWRLRQYIIRTTGDGSPLTEWSFGQILALTTWIPVFIDFFHTLFCRLPILLLLPSSFFSAKSTNCV